MNPPDEFQKRATDCMQMARLSRDPESKAMWNRMAARWRRCAETYEVQSLAARDQSPKHHRQSPPGLGSALAHRLARLRARHERPRTSRTTDKRDELGAAAHSMTSSARIKIEAGTVNPSALAVLRLMNISNLVGCTTGKSAGFAPLSILPA
jgi:hypothetical protein